MPKGFWIMRQKKKKWNRNMYTGQKLCVTYTVFPKDKCSCKMLELVTK